MQASVFEISIFPLVLQIPVSQRIHIGGECVHVYAQNIESDLLAEGVSGNGEKGGRKRNVRASRHRRTLRLHPIPRFYSLIPLCSPPWEPGRLLFLPSHLDTDVPTSTALALPSRPSSSSRAPSSLSTLSRHPVFSHSCFLFLSFHACSNYPLVPLFRSSQQYPLPGLPTPVIRSVPSSSPSPRQPREPRSYIQCCRYVAVLSEEPHVYAGRYAQVYRQVRVNDDIRLSRDTYFFEIQFIMFQSNSDLITNIVEDIYNTKASLRRLLIKVLRIVKIE